MTGGDSWLYFIVDEVDALFRNVGTLKVSVPITRELFHHIGKSCTDLL